MTNAQVEIEKAILEYAKAAAAGGDVRFANDLEIYGGVIAHAIFTTLESEGLKITSERSIEAMSTKKHRVDVREEVVWGYFKILYCCERKVF